MGRSAMTVAGVVLALSMSGPGLVAQATPADQTPPVVETAARIDHVEQMGDRRTALFVFSPAMDKVVQVQILHPTGTAKRPSLYLLDGVSAGSESDYTESTWTQKTDAVEFFATRTSTWCCRSVAPPATTPIGKEPIPCWVTTGGRRS